MRNDLAQPIIRTWLEHVKTGRSWIDPDLADGAEFPSSHYTDPTHLAAEKAQLFDARPHVVALSADLPDPGSYVTRSQFDVPLLVSRDRDGRVRAMANVCAHRGSQVVGGGFQPDAHGHDEPDSRGCARRHACPYHAWTYDEAGELVAVPDQRAFPTVDVPGPGLAPIPAVEAHGLIWAWPGASKQNNASGVATPMPPLMEAPDLGVIGTDLDHFNIGGHRHWRSHRFDLAMNWKLVIDTFLEPYHFASLHRNTVGPIFHPNLCFADRHGDQVRHLAPRRSLSTLADEPPESWNIVPHSALVYVLFPATVFVMQIDHIETWRVHPVGGDPSRSICDLDFYIPDVAPTESSERHWENNWRLTIDTVEHEDFATMAGAQRGLLSGAVSRVRFGANEPALIHYHRALTEATEPPSIGSPPNATA